MDHVQLLDVSPLREDRFTRRPSGERRLLALTSPTLLIDHGFVARLIDRRDADTASVIYVGQAQVPDPEVVGTQRVTATLVFVSIYAGDGTAEAFAQLHARLERCLDDPRAVPSALADAEAAVRMEY